MRGHAGVFGRLRRGQPEPRVRPQTQACSRAHAALSDVRCQGTPIVSGQPAYTASMRLTIERIEVSPLIVPLIEPFVIASGRMDATSAVLVRASVVDAAGARATGLG